MDYIIIGEIIKAQGIKGEVKIKPLTDDVTRYKKLKLVYIDTKPYTISSLRFDGGYVYMCFTTVTDRNTSETLRGKTIKIDKVNAVAVGENEFFIDDIVGCTIVDESENLIGKITEVLQLGAADVFVAKNTAGKYLRFPFLKKLFVLTDVANKKLIIKKELLDEVCVYDD